MSQFTQRPDGIPFHAATWSSSDPLIPVRESAYRFAGYTPNVTLVPAADHNGKFQSIGFWLGYLDCFTLRNADWLDVAVITQLSTSKLAWETGQDATISPGADVNSRTTILFNGTRVETDTTFLQTPIDPEDFPDSAEPLFVATAPKPGRIWAYMSESGGLIGVRVEGVAAGAADSPGPGEITLRAVNIDASGLTVDHTDPVTLPLPARELPINIPVLFVDGDFSGDVLIGGTLGVTGTTTLDVLNAEEITAGGGTGVPLTVSSVPAGVVGLVVIGAGDAAAVTIDGNGDTGLSVDGDVTLGTGATQTLTVNAIAEFQTQAVFNNNVDLGDAPGDAIAVKGTATFSAPLITDDTSTINKLMTIIGGVGAGLTSDATAVLNWLGTIAANGRLRVLGTTLSAAGDLGTDGSENPRWYANGASRFLHFSDVGAFKGHGQVSLISAAATITLDTSSAVAPKVASDVDVFATANISRAAAGVVTVSLIEVGVGQIGTTETFNIPSTISGDTFSLVFARTHAASTTARVYQLSIAGGGSDVTSGTARITATPAVV